MYKESGGGGGEKTARRKNIVCPSCPLGVDLSTVTSGTCMVLHMKVWLYMFMCVAVEPLRVISEYRSVMSRILEYLRALRVRHYLSLCRSPYLLNTRRNSSTENTERGKRQRDNTKRGQ